MSRRPTVAGLAALALVLACGGEGGDGEPGAADTSPRPVVADTQVVVDSLGNRFEIVTFGRPVPVRRLVPRAGSGDPDAPGVVEVVTPREAHERMGAATPPWYVIDLRSARAYVEGHIEGTRSLLQPDILERNLDDLQIRVDHTILVHGESDGEAMAAARLLASYGFPRVRVLEGGFAAWQRAGLPVAVHPAAGGEE